MIGNCDGHCCELIKSFSCHKAILSLFNIQGNQSIERLSSWLKVTLLVRCRTRIQNLQARVLTYFILSTSSSYYYYSHLVNFYYQWENI